MRILIAEDETIIRMDLRALLERLGFEVCGEARDGEEAIELARSLEPDLAIMDVKMPRLDGIEVLQRLRADKRTSVLPVVILTTSSEDIDLVRAYESGANAYVRKPVSLAQFQEAVRQLGLFWILTNEPPKMSR